MASNILVMVDLLEIGYNIPQDGMFTQFDDPNRIDLHIRDISTRWPNSTICVYRLTDLQKIKKSPEYARYKVNQETGEIVPA